MDLRCCTTKMKKGVRESGGTYIKNCYLALSEKLNQKYRPEKTRTFFEDILYSLIRSNTKQQVLRSIWIGKRNIDLFIPAFKSTNKSKKILKGIAIEVDGDIHNAEFKMKKDNDKFQTLLELNICPMQIKNHDIEDPNVKKILEALSQYRNYDFRSKQRLMRNIHLKTIIANKQLVLESQLTSCISVLRAIGEL